MSLKGDLASFFDPFFPHTVAKHLSCLILAITLQDKLLISMYTV